MDDLRAKHCERCVDGMPKLDAVAIGRLAPAVPAWSTSGERLRRRFVFDDFVQAMRFVNRMAEIAEGEGHHPDFCVHYREVEVTIWTHAAAGLTENDFILAVKIDAL